MLLNAALAAWRETFSPPLRRILWKSLALTAALLALVWFALTRLLSAFLAAHPLSTDYPFLDALAAFLAGAGLLLVLVYLLPAVSALVAGYFVDDAAAIVEARDYPDEPVGRAMPLARSVLYGLRFALLALGVNLVALVLFFVPGVNLLAFFGANAYLLGRANFELAAARHRSLPEAVAMRRQNAPTVLLAGALLAGLMVVPILNLITPIFGIALMVHVHKGLSNRRLIGAGPSAARLR